MADQSAAPAGPLCELGRLESLQKFAEKAAIILDSITDQFIAISRDWRFTFLNRRAAEQMRVLGKDPGLLIGRVLWDEFPDLPNAATLRRVMADRVPITDSYFHPSLGEWIECHLYPCPDGGILAIQKYVTERKRAEEELRRTQTYLTEAQALSHTGSWVFNLRTHDVFWSAETFRIFGLESAQFVPNYENCMDAVHPDDRPPLEEAFGKAIAERASFAFDFRIIRPSGEVRRVRSLAHPAFDGAGELTEYVGTAIDMTDRDRAEGLLRRSQEQLAHATRMMAMGELTASIAHELNQPLAAVVANGAACLRWLARDQPDLDQAQRAVERIVRDGERAGDVLRRIRAFLKRRELSTAQLQVSELVTDVLNLVQHEARAHEIAVRVQFGADLPLLSGDRVQLQQVLLNLVLNAIEAMSVLSGRARVLQVEGERNGADGVRVRVRDSGKGFDPTEADQLFDAFYTTKPNGLGLGLAISRSIIEAHGGKLTASHGPDEGTTFEFVLPASRAGFRA
jgi:PAS domain S-box-containing protein